MVSGWNDDSLRLVGVDRLHYYRTGHGDKRPLVLLHGFSDSGLCWSRPARDLEAEYDIVMPDMRGHGLSARARPGDQVDMAADVVALIRTLGLERPIVGGHSMGAMVAFEVGTRHPGLVRALVLEDPPWWLDRPGSSPAQWAKELDGKTTEGLMAEIRGEQPSWSDEMVRLWAESKKQLDPGIIDRVVDKVGQAGFEWQSAIADLTQPLLLLTGNPDLGALVTPQIAATVRELNPRVTVVNVPSAGHLIRYNDYPAFMDAVRSFLERIPS